MDSAKVFNRSHSVVVYNIPENNIRREFAPGEIKDIPLDELTQLTYRPGGKELLAEYLQIKDRAAVDQISLKIEPEYWMDQNNVKKLIQSGSLNEFLDCLDFAPRGVIDLIKDFAVQLPMNDSSKRNALKEKTGFDVDKVLLNKKLEQQASNENVETESTPKRRVPAATEERRVVTPQPYKVVEKS